MHVAHASSGVGVLNHGVGGGGSALPGPKFKRVRLSRKTPASLFFSGCSQG